MSKNLTEKQWAAVVIMSHPHKLTHEQIAEEVGVSRRTIFNWKKDDEFNKALKDQIMRNTVDRLPEVMASVPDHIINDGNAAMFRTLLQAHGMLTEKHEVETKDNNAASIEDIRSKIAEYKAVQGDDIK